MKKTIMILEQGKKQIDWSTIPDPDDQNTSNNQTVKRDDQNNTPPVVDQNLLKKFNALVKEGDSLVKSGKLADAKLKYESALKLKQDSIVQKKLDNVNSKLKKKVPDDTKKVESTPAQINYRKNILENAVNFIQDAFIIQPEISDDTKPIYEATYEYMKDKNVAKYVALILNAYKNLGTINKQHLNYVMTAGGEESMSPWYTYTEDLLQAFRKTAWLPSGGYFGSGQKRFKYLYNLKNFYIYYINKESFRENTDMFVPIIEMLSSRGIASVRLMADTENVYDVKPKYQIFSNPANILKYIYDQKLFG